MSFAKWRPSGEGRPLVAGNQTGKLIVLLRLEGQMMGDEELKNKGQGLMDGTDAPST